VLKRLREKSGLTADQVGKMIGKSGKTVNAWENNRGQPDAEILMQLCSIYNVKNILAEFNPNSAQDDIVLSEHEKALIIAYRSNSAMQSAVDKLLGIEVTGEAVITNKKDA
jgi:transcriptional regulator with XRE-family HTH domain